MLFRITLRNGEEAENHFIHYPDLFNNCVGFIEELRLNKYPVADKDYDMCLGVVMLFSFSVFLWYN